MKQETLEEFLARGGVIHRPTHEEIRARHDRPLSRNIIIKKGDMKSKHMIARAIDSYRHTMKDPKLEFVARDPEVLRQFTDGLDIFSDHEKRSQSYFIHGIPVRFAVTAPEWTLQLHVDGLLGREFSATHSMGPA